MRQWIWSLPAVVIILTGLPQPAKAGSEAQSCPQATLQQAIAQLSVDQTQSAAQQVLTRCGDAAIPPLATALSEPNATIRRYAAQTLGAMGWEANAATGALITASRDDRNPQVRRAAIQALSAIARSSQQQSAQWQSWQINDIQALQAFQKELDGLVSTLKQDPQNWPTKAEDLATLQLAHSSLPTQLNALTEQPTYQIGTWAQGNPWIAGAGLLGLLLISTYGGIFLLKPIWLLKLGDEQIQAIAAIHRVGKVLSGLLQGLSPLKYHPRVLDAWVKQHISNVRKELLQHPTFQRHDIHITQPVFRQANPQPVAFEPAQFADIFKRKFRLVIWGEGGAGKTSLACQFAYWAMWGRSGEQAPDRDDPKLVKKLCQHRMIPVLIEEKLGEKSLLDAIGAKLKELTGADEISNDLLLKLLQQRRVLVIVDHLSEITDESTRQKVRPSQNKDYPVNALIVTSRDATILGKEAIALVQPGRITTTNLADFLNRYLPEKQKRESIRVTFDPDDYADAYKDLGNMISLRQAAEVDRNQRPGTTILLVKLYADQMIVEKQKREKLGEHYFTTQQNLADNVPDLMLNYLDALRLNTRDDDSQTLPGGLPQPEEQTLKLYRLAQLVAWKCLEKTYKPESASREEVVEALTILESQFHGEKPEELAKQDLEYLKALTLIQFQSKDRTLRLSLDPLAEYLAALYQFWEYQTNQDAWMLFLEQLETTVNPSDVRGFLLALYDCCDKKGRGKPVQIPAAVLKKLVQLTELDQAKIDTYYRERRMRLALEDLKERDLIYQSRAIADLTAIAHKDQTLRQSALRCLTEVLKDKQRETQVRQEAGEALGKLRLGAEGLLSLLSDPTEAVTLRRIAAESLGRMKAGQAELLQILAANDQPLPVRQGTARALSLIGAPDGEPVPMLMVELQAGERLTQVKAIPVWREPLTEDLCLNLVAIPGGEFLMGSPPDEAGRDWYKYNFPELVGVDVEQQHRVTVPPFAMSQSPITQAQWRFVAGLPRIDRDLEPDPANFKGDDRPIEVVSWHEAMEFCARLSQFTGKIYRLPSEAEWEYACRAGTETPFHFGETLSVDIANYDGSYTYGNGVVGEYRQKTTEAGSLGVVNAFGLADMHGNVFEWCADHWHPSYAGAPTDGSAWITGGDDRYRMVRGGSWYDNPGYCRSANRLHLTPTNRNNSIGFRVVCVSPWTR